LAFRQLQDQMLHRPGGDREMADILALVLHHDEQVVGSVPHENQHPRLFSVNFNLPSNNVRHPSQICFA
jgi:hypothetical protein